MVQVIIRVLYVSELKNNLLSIRQLQEKGLAILFQHDRSKVYHSEKGLIMDTKMSRNRCSDYIPQCPPVLAQLQKKRFNSSIVDMDT
ncbi:Retrovirus-related Pol polyprotein from transposon TNT 1-94 [Gossypium australe]|uniref:Retrovirus-related Pol polyprotein from transposon TNT 1-94 n=1 Tax=Gossypium australe TaxID=47621 RepID=A0A5B6VQ18_9ROSI|nr:Retrovirus-related Pol polyprotein from transposon TNT 1-94 [Gossypium australe]